MGVKKLESLRPNQEFKLVQQRDKFTVDREKQREAVEEKWRTAFKAIAE